MTKLLLSSIILISILTSCSKEERLDLSYLCDKGDLWLADRVDSFNPDHSLDSFYFNQGAGFHRFIFTNSYVNRLQIDVLTKPTIGQTIIYNKQYIKSITGSIITQNFNYDNLKDSLLTITNNGSNYIINLKTISVYTDSRNIDLRACSLKMTDTLP